MLLRQVLSRTQSSEALLTPRKHTPWIDSPLEPAASSQHSGSIRSEQENHAKPAHEKADGLRFSVPDAHDVDRPIFKHRHESSTVELFYDLFFVANLATFTANHEIVNVDSLKNYIGFFTILWFTWLETSLFDVRFASDSVFNRVCKAVSFGVMTGFAVTGAIYDQNNVGENVKAFRALSIILMVSRLCLAVQYAVVLFYVKGYPKIWAPLLSTIATFFIAAMIFFGTFFGYNLKDTGTSFPNQAGGPNTYIAYYIVVCVEALAIITISCFWRVVSFKHTHLVERIGLLTLIIMGEGIIGMSKSVSKILQNSSSTSSSDIGTIIASVLLIYFIWILYFDQIENDRFGTIRQQIWAILHYPLHVAILLTVEGSTALILWNIITSSSTDLFYWYPVSTLDEYHTLYNSPQNLTDFLRYGIESFSTRFKSGALLANYNYETNLTSINHLNSTFEFGGKEWDEKTGEIVDEMFLACDNFIFENFGLELPKTATHAGKGGSELATSSGFYNIFNTVFTYFFISAGAFLIILAIMYWFGKTRKTRGEWASIAVRVLAGIGITMASLSDWYSASYWSSYYFLNSPWLVPVVVLGYFVVIVADNLLVWHTNKTIGQKTDANDRERTVSDASGSGDTEVGSARARGDHNV